MGNSVGCFFLSVVQLYLYNMRWWYHCVQRMSVTSRIRIFNSNPCKLMTNIPIIFNLHLLKTLSAIVLELLVDSVHSRMQ